MGQMMVMTEYRTKPGRRDREVIAHALNERFVELGRNHSVPYVRVGENE